MSLALRGRYGRHFSSSAKVPWLAVVAVGVLIAGGATCRPATASWWGNPVSGFDIRGIKLGMTADATAKLHPELIKGGSSSWTVINGQRVTTDPALQEQEMQNAVPCPADCFRIDFAPPKLGGGAYYIYMTQTLSGGADAADVLKLIEKKYGSPTDVDGGKNIVSDDTNYTATWGLSVADSQSDGSFAPATTSGKGMIVHVQESDGEVDVSFDLRDFGLEAQDNALQAASRAAEAKQLSDTAGKAIND